MNTQNNSELLCKEAKNKEMEDLKGNTLHSILIQINRFWPTSCGQKMTMPMKETEESEVLCG